jgi:hypothetical protein
MPHPVIGSGSARRYPLYAARSHSLNRRLNIGGTRHAPVSALLACWSGRVLQFSNRLDDDVVDHFRLLTRAVSYEDRRGRVESVILDLGLKECADTLVGDEHVRCAGD